MGGPGKAGAAHCATGDQLGLPSRLWALVGEKEGRRTFIPFQQRGLESRAAQIESHTLSRFTVSRGGLSFRPQKGRGMEKGEESPGGRPASL